MSADTSDLTKVDSAVSGLSSSPTDAKGATRQRKSSSYPGVFNINDLGTLHHVQKSCNDIDALLREGGNQD